MSDISQLNVRLWNADIEIVKRLAKQRHVSQAVVVAEAIRLLDSTQTVGRYKACTQLGLADHDRRKFVHWSIKNDVPPTATMAEWEDYLEEFATEGDGTDLDATQQDALGVLA